MKRKLALLLAAVMIIAAMPMNVFAASQGNAINPQTNAENKTVFFERGMAPGQAGDVTHPTNGNIKFWVDGTNLQIVFDRAVDLNSKITLTLENAKWFFRNDGNVTQTTNLPAIPAAHYPNSQVVNHSVTLPTAAIDVASMITLPASTALSTFQVQNLFNNVGGSIDWNTAITTFLPALVTNLTAHTNALNTGALQDAKDDVEASVTTGAAVTIGTIDPSAALTSTGPTAPYTANTNYMWYDAASVNAAAMAALADKVKAGLLSGEIIATTNAASDKVILSYAPSVTYTIPVTYNFLIEMAVAAVTGAPGATGVPYRTDGFGNADPASLEFANFAGFPGGAKPLTTYNLAKGIMQYDSVARKYVYTRLAKVDGQTGAGNTSATPVTPGEYKPYTLTVMTEGDQTTAEINITEAALVNDGILIPLVLLTNKDGDYRIRVDQRSTSGVANGNLLIGAKAEGKTNTALEGSATVRRNEIVIPKLRIQEVRTGSIFSGQRWSFEIRAPKGYEFMTDDLVANLPTVPDGSFAIYTEGGLKWNDLVGSYFTGTIPPQYLNTAAGIRVNFKEKNNNVDRSILVVDVGPNVFQRSVATIGSLYFNGLTLLAEDEDNIPFDKQLYITMKDTNNNFTIITDQEVPVAIPKDYDITLKRVKDEIPELISGRYEEGVRFNAAGTYVDFIDDDEHKAAKVKFSEVVADAWWAQRNTTFTLPKEARYMKVDFDNTTVATTNSNMPSAAVNRLLTGTNAVPVDGTGIYYNTGRRSGAVTIDDNVMTLTNLAVNSNSKASFEFDTWLSIQVDYTGDVDITLDRKALQYCDRDDDIVCTIAKAIRPIEVVTTVTEAKVGYQYVAVADFEIIENRAGALLDSEDAYISVTDEITIDMAIANTFDWTVSEGNIKLKDVTTGNVLGYGTFSGSPSGSGDRHITFTVQRESSIASTIKFSSVEVKIDRYVPFSNESHLEIRGISLHVWGPAVAKNYYYLNSAADYVPVGTGFAFNPRDFFTVAGISTKYVNIATLATDSNQAGFVNHVVVTIDSTTYTVNGAVAELEVAPYISAESNSTMVPVRFIANALGLSEFAVSWDNATRTVTVDANNRIIQFQAGSTYYTVNGTPVPMVSPDGLPVAMEITNNRAFVPFRALGDAFGIPVDWDGTTNSAIYNKPIMQ